MSEIHETDVAAPGAQPADEPLPTRFRVTLQCPTPIARAELEVEAADEAAAWRAFCAANGISDSEHARTIVRVD